MPVKRERPTASAAKPNKRAKLSSYRGVSQNKGRWVGQVSPQPMCWVFGEGRTRPASGPARAGSNIR